MQLLVLFVSFFSKILTLHLGENTFFTSFSIPNSIYFHTFALEIPCCLSMTAGYAELRSYHQGGWVGNGTS